MLTATQSGIVVAIVAGSALFMLPLLKDRGKIRFEFGFLAELVFNSFQCGVAMGTIATVIYLVFRRIS